VILDKILEQEESIEAETAALKLKIEILKALISQLDAAQIVVDELLPLHKK